MLITINQKYKPGMSEAALYEATRKFWRVAKSRRQIGSANAPEWTVAVYRGVVRGVYWIEGSEQPTSSDIFENPKREGRWAFIGLRAQEMEERYLNRDVSQYLRSTGNPIAYEPR